MTTIDQQGRPDLLNSERAYELAKTTLAKIEVEPVPHKLCPICIKIVANVLLEVQSHALSVGRRELGVGRLER